MLSYRTRSLPLHIHALNLAFRVSSSRRFYCVQPPPPSSSTPTPADDEPRGIKGNLEWYFAKSFETVPYTNRTRRILYPRDIELEYGESLFKRLEEKLMENEGMLLSPTHPDVVRVKMVFNNIIDAFRYSVSDGKTHQIVVSHDLVNLFDGRDIELAVIISQVVARNVARHKGERLTKQIWITILGNILGENFTEHIGLKILSLIRRLPFNKRLNAKAEYIGFQLLASAGYDPQQVAEAYEKMGAWIKI